MRHYSVITLQLILFGLFTVSPSAFAHLKQDPGVPCFKMVNGQVTEINNTLTRDAAVEILETTSVPSWVADFKMGDVLNLHIRYRVALCRPFSIFAEPIHEANKTITRFTSPSPVYDPGEREGVHSAFIGFKPVKGSDSEASMTITGVRVFVEEYGSGKRLAEAEYPINAAWTPVTGALKATERCTDTMEWPDSTAMPDACDNSVIFEHSEGFEVTGKVDLNYDGICELLVKVASCRKLNNNTCYKIFEERNGAYRAIWQYYNKLRTFGHLNGYAKLGSTETGPSQYVHRFGRFDPTQNRYVSERILTPCR